MLYDPVELTLVLLIAHHAKTRHVHFGEQPVSFAASAMARLFTQRLRARLEQRNMEQLHAASHRSSSTSTPSACIGGGGDDKSVPNAASTAAQHNAGADATSPAADDPSDGAVRARFRSAFRHIKAARALRNRAFDSPDNADNAGQSSQKRNDDAAVEQLALAAKGVTRLRASALRFESAWQAVCSLP